jgi:hypothetical protein
MHAEHHERTAAAGHYAAVVAPAFPTIPDFRREFMKEFEGKMAKQSCHEHPRDPQHQIIGNVHAPAYRT